MKYKNNNRQLFSIPLLIVVLAISAAAQTTAFNYQGSFTDTGTPQTIYPMEFRLFGSAGGADQIGSAVTNLNVAVSQNVFSVLLDFGSNAFTGTDTHEYLDSNEIL